MWLVPLLTSFLNAIAHVLSLPSHVFKCHFLDILLRKDVYMCRLDVVSKRMSGQSAEVRTDRFVEKVKVSFKSIVSQPAPDELELDFDSLDKEAYAALSAFINTLM